ncbi:MAG: aldose 1-epimerase family protein [Rhodothermales bacterium]
MFDRSRQVLEQHSLDMRQFIDCRESRLSNGMRVLDVYNGSGLTFTLLPDRGLDIWTAHYGGHPLTWISPGSPHPPDHGSPWLRQFNGGLLTTCGLRHVGPPEVDEETGEQRDVHGRFTRLAADVVRREGRWVGDEYVFEIAGRIVQSSLFGEQLLVERTYRVRLGEPAIELEDVVTNVSDVATPFMLLYHINVGYPLVREGARFDVAAARTLPRDDAAEAGFETWADYPAAQREFAEQVFYHHVQQRGGWAKALLANGDLGLMVSWDTTHAPYLSQWKNVRSGMYVCGIEPGNCVPEGQNAARRGGRLLELDAGASHAFRTRFHIYKGANEIEGARGDVAELRSAGTSVSGFNWCRTDLSRSS